MVSNDLHLLDSRLEAKVKTLTHTMDPGAFFNFYVAELLLRRYQPGIPAVLSGLVDGPADCGIDAFYCFVNHQLVSPDSTYQYPTPDPRVEVIVLQAKRATKFTEEVLDKLQVHLPELLDFDRNDTDLATRVAPALLESTRTFLDVCRNLAPLNPKISIHIHYATRADVVHENTKARAQNLKQNIERLFGGGHAQVQFHGPRQLLALARQQDDIHKRLSIADGPISSEGPDGEGYVCLVTLEEFFRFLCEEGSDNLQVALFEANVRDHEKSSDVNKAIHDTLAAPEPSEFWWLNNGVTIISPRVQHMGKKLFIENPQIVNGLQTSTELHKYFKNGGINSSRLLLLKIICAKKDDVRDEIIRATNNQNQLRPGALRATERLQHDIEEYLTGRGFFYDRRKNHYVNQKVDVDKILSMESLAQSMATTLLLEPWRARADAGALLDSDLYHRIFSDDIPLQCYLTSILLTRRTRKLLRRTPAFMGSVPQHFEDDFVYHVTAVATVLLTRNRNPSAQTIGNLDPNLMTLDVVQDILPLVASSYKKFMGSNVVRAESSAAKDQATSEDVLYRARKLLQSSRLREWPSRRLPLGYQNNLT